MKKSVVVNVILAMVCMFFIVACSGSPDPEPVVDNCKIDSDHDGIPDCSDMCPNTPIGSLVDGNGCVVSQKDSDGDGVNDEKDLCPNTPKGESVDTNGCAASQKDSDGDGVMDDKDLCPNTPAGEKVDANGCTIALVHDGSSFAQAIAMSVGETVQGNLKEENYLRSYYSFSAISGKTYEIKSNANSMAVFNSKEVNLYSGSYELTWQCPANGTYYVLVTAVVPMTFTLKVSELILPVDSDGDGVLDSNDKCPNTPKGESVDANGCAASQKDSDGDGVKDEKDLCPNTPKGESVDANGCAASQKDSDGDGVKDEKDLCPNTPKGESVDVNGCASSQKDSDGDGVMDDKDLCPNTPAGADVDGNGCVIVVPDGLSKESAFPITINHEMKGVSVGNIIYFSFTGKKDALYDLDVVADTSVKTSLLDSTGKVVISSTDGDSFLFNIHNWVCPGNGTYYLEIEYLIPNKEYTINIGEQILESCTKDTDGDGIVDCIDLVNNDGSTVDQAIFFGVNHSITNLTGGKKYFQFQAKKGMYYIIDATVTNRDIYYISNQQVTLIDLAGKYLAYYPGIWGNISEIRNWLCPADGKYIVLVESNDPTDIYNLSVSESNTWIGDLEKVFGISSENMGYDRFENDYNMYRARFIALDEVQQRTSSSFQAGYFDFDWLFFHVEVGVTYEFRVIDKGNTDMNFSLYGREGGTSLIYNPHVNSQSIFWTADRTDWMLIRLVSWITGSEGYYTFQVVKAN